MTERRTFTYTQIDVEELVATDLRQEVIQANDNDHVSAYSIRIGDMAEKAEALYFPMQHRLGIAWGADATWADVETLESGIEMYVNDGEAWNARN